MGGKDQQPCTIDPKEPNKAYCPTNNWCMELEPQERTHTQQGTVYVFANVYMYPEKPGITGKFKKFDVLTGETDWEIPDQYPNWGGTLVTDGGLMFYGSLGGDFRAVDRKTGIPSIRPRLTWRGRFWHASPTSISGAGMALLP